MPNNLHRLFTITGALFAASGLAPAHGQTLLDDPSFFASVVGLNTVPDHGDEAVSFLDYRNGGYSIIAVDLASGTEHEIERVYYAEPVVTTFGRRLAWIGYTPAGPADVYVHDRTTGRTTRLTSDEAFQNHPDLYADILVWQDYRNAGTEGTNADVYMHDFASNTTSPITVDPGYQDLPRIHGNWVVWQDYRHAGSTLNTAEIYAYSLVTKQEQRLTTGSAFRSWPSVWGDLVVWEDYRNGANGDIYLYDLSANREIPITSDAAHQTQPSVFGDWVLWLDYRNSSAQGDLYGYNLKTEQEYALLVHPAHQDAPHVYEDHVVWQDYRNGLFDLFGGTLSDPAVTTIEPAESRHGGGLSVAPNPFAHSVSFTLADPPSSPVTLMIHDVLGRTVVHRQHAPGNSRISWDGLTDSGEAAAAGIYVVVITGREFVRHGIFVRHP